MKAKTLFFLLFFVLTVSLFLIPNNVYAQDSYEWITNGGFETGERSPFIFLSQGVNFMNEDADYVANGSYSMGGNGDFAFHYNIPYLYADNFLNLSMWVIRPTGAQEINFRVRISYSDGTYDNIYTDTVTDFNTWTKLDIANTSDIISGKIIQRIQFLKISPYDYEYSIYFDDISLLADTPYGLFSWEMSPIPIEYTTRTASIYKGVEYTFTGYLYSSGNLIGANYGFEWGNTSGGWENSTSWITSAIKRTGTYGMFVSLNNYEMWYNFTTAVVVNEILNFTCWGYPNEDEGTECQGDWTFYYDDDTNSYNPEEDLGTEYTWNQYNLSQYLDSGKNLIAFKFTQDSSVSTTFDDFELYVTSGIGQYGEGSFSISSDSRGVLDTGTITGGTFSSTGISHYTDLSIQSIEYITINMSLASGNIDVILYFTFSPSSQYYPDDGIPDASSSFFTNLFVLLILLLFIPMLIGGVASQLNPSFGFVGFIGGLNLMGFISLSLEFINIWFVFGMLILDVLIILAYIKMSR